MPVIERFGSVTLRLYPGDHHPPHFHIVGPDFEILVRLSDFVVLEGIARRNQIEEAMAWARANRNALAAKWATLNERS